MSGTAGKTEDVVVADYGELLARLASMAAGNREAFYAYTVETPQGGLIVVDVGRTLHVKTSEPKAMLALTINLRRDGIIKGGTIDADTLIRQAGAHKARPAAAPAATTVNLPASRAATASAQAAPPTGMGALESAAPLAIDPTSMRNKSSRPEAEAAPPPPAPQPVEPIVSAQSRVGRNDPCPCGSGKKHKKCCGRK